MAEGRQALRALLIGSIRMQPVREERRRGYRFSATIALDRLLAGVVELPIKMASPTGTALVGLTAKLSRMRWRLPLVA